jgi:uncharacterized protein (TIGR02284 family)
MGTKEAIKKLSLLMQLDVDAIGAYEQALEKIEHTLIKEAIVRFQEAHRTHVQQLKEAITRLGGQPPSEKPDLKGYLLEGFTALRSVTGTEGALKAMKSNEQLTNKRYREALDWSIPAELQPLIEKNYQDEQAHLRYIEQSLENRAWLETRTQ